MSVLNELIEKAPEHTLREFARKCALRHVEKIKPYCSDKDYELIVKWLETGEGSLRQGTFFAARSAGKSDAYLAEIQWQEQTLSEMMESNND